MQNVVAFLHARRRQKAAAVSKLGDNGHVDGDSLAVKQWRGALQSSHLELWSTPLIFIFRSLTVCWPHHGRKCVAMIDQSPQDMFVQVGLQLLEHALDGASHSDAAELALTGVG